MFEPTVASAVRYANAGLLEEWLTLYFSQLPDRKCPAFDQVVCYGVRKVPLRLIEAGTDRETASEMLVNVELGQPFIVSYREGKFSVVGQEEFYFGLKRQKINAYPALILVLKEEYKQFERQYGRYFIEVK